MAWGLFPTFSAGGWKAFQQKYFWYYCITYYITKENVLNLTELLDNVPSVDIFDLNKICYMISDASLYGSGACINQMDSLGNPSVCSWFSKKLNGLFIESIRGVHSTDCNGVINNFYFSISKTMW